MGAGELSAKPMHEEALRGSTSSHLQEKIVHGVTEPPLERQLDLGISGISEPLS